jgi:hypothetical protein
MGFYPTEVHNYQGQLIKWTALAINSGSSVATNVAMNLSIPNELEVQTVTVGKGSYNTQTKIWHIGSLSGQEESEITIYFNVAIVPTGNLSIVSNISGTGVEVDNGNNTKTDTLSFVPFDNFQNGFKVSSDTWYVSKERNLNNEVGTPRKGDLSRVKNVNSVDFNWATLGDDSTFVSLFTDSYSNVVAKDTIFDANMSNFDGLLVDNATVKNTGDIGALTLKNGGRVTATKATGVTIQSNASSLDYQIDLAELVGDITFQGTQRGNIVFNIGTFGGGSIFTTLTPDLAEFNITLNIDSLKGLLIIDEAILNGASLHINVKNNAGTGHIRFNNISVDDYSSIIVTGHFHDIGTGIPILISILGVGVNDGNLANRINISDCVFNINSAVGVDIENISVIGANIKNCSFVTLGSDPIGISLTAISKAYLYNCITNDVTVNYPSNPSVLGTITQDANFG